MKPTDLAHNWKVISAADTGHGSGQSCSVDGCSNDCANGWYVSKNGDIQMVCNQCGDSVPLSYESIERSNPRIIDLLAEKEYEDSTKEIKADWSEPDQNVKAEWNGVGAQLMALRYQARIANSIAACMAQPVGPGYTKIEVRVEGGHSWFTLEITPKYPMTNPGEEEKHYDD